MNNYLGINLDPLAAANILAKLGFEVTKAENQLQAVPPSWRSRDIEDDVDLIEEIARIYGYHNLPAKLPSGQIPRSSESRLKDIIELKKALKFLGLTEIISYSIISRDLLQLTKTPTSQIVELANPLTEIWQFMRPSILPSLLQTLTQNINLSQNLKLFEVAKTYIAQKNALPKQDLMLSIVLSGADFYRVKGLIENVFEILKRPLRWQASSKNNPLFSPNQSAEIKIGEQVVGSIGVVSSNVTDFFNIKTPVAAAEINLTKIYQFPVTSYQYKPIPKYPPVIEDISAIFAKAVSVAEIVETIKKATVLVKKVEVIDIFESEKIGENKKSVSLKLTYQKTTATPTQSEVDEQKAKIIASLEKEFRAKIRK